MTEIQRQYLEKNPDEEQSIVNGISESKLVQCKECSSYLPHWVINCFVCGDVIQRPHVAIMYSGRMKNGERAYVSLNRARQVQDYTREHPADFLQPFVREGGKEVVNKDFVKAWGDPIAKQKANATGVGKTVEKAVDNGDVILNG